MTDDFSEFEKMRKESREEMARDSLLTQQARDLSVSADRYSYSYQWDWLGLPIIQMPNDVVAMQEIIWRTKPNLIIESGIARGGSLVFLASMLQLIGEGEVLGIDIDIRPHNRTAIENHPLSHRVTLLQGSSVDQSTVEQVRDLVSKFERVMVILDSNHTHDHVLSELREYSPFVSPSQYLIVADTAIELIPPQDHRPRDWGPGNSPLSAVNEFDLVGAGFEIDADLEAKLLMTSSPQGYWRKR